MPRWLQDKLVNRAPEFNDSWITAQMCPFEAPILSLRHRATKPSWAAKRRRMDKKSKRGALQEVIRESLRNEDSADAEFQAALAYAKRRRLGPYRIPPDDNHPRRQKDLASMGRAGFAFDIARQILDD